MTNQQYSQAIRGCIQNNTTPMITTISAVQPLGGVGCQLTLTGYPSHYLDVYTEYLCIVNANMHNKAS